MNTTKRRYICLLRARSNSALLPPAPLASAAAVRRSQAARHTAAEYRRALQLRQPKVPGWEPPVLRCSALHHEDINQVGMRGSRRSGPNENPLTFCLQHRFQSPPGRSPPSFSPWLHN
jgi:hypothetical protein